MALESCEIHFAEYLGNNYILKKVGQQWFHGSKNFEYSLFGDKAKMTEYENKATKSLGLLLPTRLSAYNATETEN